MAYLQSKVKWKNEFHKIKGLLYFRNVKTTFGKNIHSLSSSISTYFFMHSKGFLIPYNQFSSACHPWMKFPKYKMICYCSQIKEEFKFIQSSVCRIQNVCLLLGFMFWRFLDIIFDRSSNVWWVTSSLFLWRDSFCIYSGSPIRIPWSSSQVIAFSGSPYWEISVYGSVRTCFFSFKKLGSVLEERVVWFKWSDLSWFIFILKVLII